MKVVFDRDEPVFVFGVGDLKPGVNEVGEAEGEHLVAIGLCRRADEPRRGAKKVDVNAPATADEKEK